MKLTRPPISLLESRLHAAAFQAIRTGHRVEAVADLLRRVADAVPAAEQVEKEIK